MGWEVEGAAVGNEADLSKKRRVRVRSDVLGVQVFTTYDCIRSDFTPRPIFPFAHLRERILLRKAKNVASKWLR